MRVKSRIAPIIKWAGGKQKLIDQMRNFFPTRFPKGYVYVEPFLGGASLLFWMLDQWGDDMREVRANDQNVDLIRMYQTVQGDVEALIKQLHELRAGIRESRDPAEYYYLRRAEYNDKGNSDVVRRSALLIFLNHTCYNGLYRVNRKGDFNVPYGKRQFVQIFDSDVLRADSEALKCVRFSHMDYKAVKVTGQLSDRVFYYFDPPYRPLTSTSNFCQYTEGQFDEHEQIQLAQHCRDLHNDGAWWMLSNSDTRVANPKDDFYERHYGDFHINTIMAPRMINSNALRRGAIPEVLITNYQPVRWSGTTRKRK